MITTKYGALFDTLKTEILSGKYRSSCPFPSVRALISRFRLSDRTVRRALDELFAQGLISRKQGRGTFVTGRCVSRKIGLIVPSIAGSESFPAFVSALSRIAIDKDYTLLFADIPCANSVERVKKTKAFARSLVEQDVAGLIYLPLEFLANAAECNRAILGLFTAARIPVVLLDRDIVPAPRRSDFDLVGIDNMAAGRSLAEHLIAQGARRIHFFVRPNCATIYRSRIDGAQIAIRNAGLKSDETNVLVALPDDETAIMSHLRKYRPDAFVCSSDTVAAAFCKTLSRLSVKVPDDLMLAGFNDLQLSRVLTPSLTTVHSPCEQIAEVAFSRLVERMSGAELPPLEISLPSYIVIRQSTERKKPQGRKDAKNV